MFSEKSYLYQCIAMRGLTPTPQIIHSIYMQFSPELRQRIDAWGVNDSSLREQINDELDHLI